jgi:hypothetical protein
LAQEFAVYELYWAVQALGGASAVAKWKDVGNEMMWRRRGCLVSAAPGKNYGIIKNQWERWQLSLFSTRFPDRAVPPPRPAPPLKPGARATGPRGAHNPRGVCTG